MRASSRPRCVEAHGDERPARAAGRRAATRAGAIRAAQRGRRRACTRCRIRASPVRAPAHAWAARSTPARRAPARARSGAAAAAANARASRGGEVTFDRELLGRAVQRLAGLAERGRERLPEIGCGVQGVARARAALARQLEQAAHEAAAAAVVPRESIASHIASDATCSSLAPTAPRWARAAPRRARRRSRAHRSRARSRTPRPPRARLRFGRVVREQAGLHQREQRAALERGIGYAAVEQRVRAGGLERAPRDRRTSAPACAATLARPARSTGRTPRRRRSRRRARAPATAARAPRRTRARAHLTPARCARAVRRGAACTSSGHSRDRTRTPSRAPAAAASPGKASVAPR